MQAVLRRCLLAVLCAVVLNGCGGTDESVLTERADHFYEAIDGGDGAGACADLAPETRSELEQSEGKACPDAVVGEDLPPVGHATSTQVYGSMAAVRYGTETVFLSRFGNEWKVMAAGCPPTTGDRPHDCTIKGG